MRRLSILALSTCCLTSATATELHAQGATGASEPFPAAQISELGADVVKAFNVFMTYKGNYPGGYFTGVSLSNPQGIADFSRSLVAANAPGWNNIDELTYRIYPTEAAAKTFEDQASNGHDPAQIPVDGGLLYLTNVSRANETQPFGHCLEAVLQTTMIDWARCFVRHGADIAIVTLATPHQGPLDSRPPPANLGTNAGNLAYEAEDAFEGFKAANIVSP
jgi:hypothetical protein